MTRPCVRSSGEVGCVTAWPRSRIVNLVARLPPVSPYADDDAVTVLSNELPGLTLSAVPRSIVSSGWPPLR